MVRGTHSRTVRDESFGIVPLVFHNTVWEVFLVQHKHGGQHWGFPKGHAERNETPQEAATRELSEETNLQVVRFLFPDPLQEQYQFTHEGQLVVKKVCYFIAEVSGEVRLQAHEISSGGWFSLPKAYEQLTHPEGKAILRQVEEKLFHEGKNG